MSTYVAQPESEDEKSTSHYTVPQTNQKRSVPKRRHNMGERTQSVEAKEDNKQQEMTGILSKANSWMPSMPSITEASTSISNVLKAGGTEDFLLILVLLALVFAARFTGDNPWIDIDTGFFYLVLSSILLMILYRRWQSNIKHDLEELKKKHEADKVKWEAKYDNFEKKYEGDKSKWEEKYDDFEQKYEKNNSKWAKKFDEWERAADKRVNDLKSEMRSQEDNHREQIKKLRNAEDDLRKIWEKKFEECIQQLNDMRKENESLRRQLKN